MTPRSLPVLWSWFTWGSVGGWPHGRAQAAAVAQVARSATGRIAFLMAQVAGQLCDNPARTALIISQKANPRRSAAPTLTQEDLTRPSCSPARRDLDRTERHARP